MNEKIEKVAYQEPLDSLRKARGDSKAGFSRWLGFNPRTISGWAEGRRNPSTAVLTRLIRAAEELHQPQAADLFRRGLEARPNHAAPVVRTTALDPLETLFTPHDNARVVGANVPDKPPTRAPTDLQGRIDKVLADIEEIADYLMDFAVENPSTFRSVLSMIKKCYGAKESIHYIRSLSSPPRLGRPPKQT